MSVTTSEHLWVIPKSAIVRLGIGPGLFTAPETLEGLRRILRDGFALPHQEAEADPTLIQVIPCGVIKFQDQVLLLRRRERINHRLNDKYVVWAGGHIRREDAHNTRSVEESCLLRELDEELHINGTVTYSPICCVYDTTTNKSARHLGLVFEVLIASAYIDVCLQTEFKPFRDHNGRQISGKLLPLREIGTRYLHHMERWSELLLTRYFGLRAPDALPVTPVHTSKPTTVRKHAEKSKKLPVAGPRTPQ